MTKTILITGSTDGIGLATASRLAADGHQVILHGRNSKKLAHAAVTVGEGNPGAVLGTVEADLSKLREVRTLACDVTDLAPKLDVLINNAGVYQVAETQTPDGFDVRFMVNTIAPYLLTKQLLDSIPSDGRIVNLSSAAQAPVDLEALSGLTRVGDMEAYAESKLAITMWSRHMADQLGDDGPAVIAVNPGSLLATKMVKEGWGIEGSDINAGVDILIRASLSDEFASASGRYFDNDSHQFANPHPDALDATKNATVTEKIESLIAKLSE